MMVLLIALAGGAGAVARLVLDGVLRCRTSGRFPVGTVVINLSGSLLLGLVVGLTGSLLPEAVRLVVGTGFLGGYTTFSTAAVETVRLAGRRQRAAAWAQGLGMLLAGVGLAAVGLTLGLVLVR